MQIIIDRFEGEYAVVELEDKTFENLPRTLVPEGAHEGDALEIHIATAANTQEITSLMDALFEE